MKKIVVVGQTPPPFGGQAIMIEKILAGKYQDVRLYHVRMAFSKEMDEIGKASLYKVVHLFEIIIRILFYRIFRNADVLYYPPAGPDKVPVFRDIAILLSTRWMFRKVIFHFHAGGVSSLNFGSGVLRNLFQWAYYRPDIAILLSELNPPDGKNLLAAQEFVVPYGIEDNGQDKLAGNTADQGGKILFVGIIKESKGVLVLLDACRILRERGLDFSLQLMGKFESADFEGRVKGMVKSYHLETQVSFLGVLTGTTKFNVFRECDVFCFPTFFESETFGVVLLEAMQFSLPVVSTVWRGIPSIVQDGENGFLVSPQNSRILAEKLEYLILQPSLRVKMGTSGRKIFLDKFTISKFHLKMEEIFNIC